jgi:hypothetical protein
MKMRKELIIFLLSFKVNFCVNENRADDEKFHGKNSCPSKEMSSIFRSLIPLERRRSSKEGVISFLADETKVRMKGTKNW